MYDKLRVEAMWATRAAATPKCRSGSGASRLATRGAAKSSSRYSCLFRALAVTLVT
jgi:hypothetical protein